MVLVQKLLACKKYKIHTTFNKNIMEYQGEGGIKKRSRTEIKSDLDDGMMKPLNRTTHLPSIQLPLACCGKKRPSTMSCSLMRCPLTRGPSSGGVSSTFFDKCRNFIDCLLHTQAHSFTTPTPIRTTYTTATTN